MKAAPGSPRCAARPQLRAPSAGRAALRGGDCTAFARRVAAGLTLKCGVSLFYHLCFADKKGARETFLFYVIELIIPTAVPENEPMDLTHAGNGFLCDSSHY